MQTKGAAHFANRAFFAQLLALQVRTIVCPFRKLLGKSLCVAFAAVMGTKTVLLASGQEICIHLGPSDSAADVKGVDTPKTTIQLLRGTLIFTDDNQPAACCIFYFGSAWLGWDLAMGKTRFVHGTSSRNGKAEQLPDPMMAMRQCGKASWHCLVYMS